MLHIFSPEKKNNIERDLHSGTVLNTQDVPSVGNNQIHISEDKTFTTKELLNGIHNSDHVKLTYLELSM